MKGKTHDMCHGNGKHVMHWYLSPTLKSYTLNH